MSGHEHDLTKSVWCPNCQHTHVPNIPQWTWACRQCGFGSWSDKTAENHEKQCPSHELYAEEHPVVPLDQRPDPTDAERPDETERGDDARM